MRHGGDARPFGVAPGEVLDFSANLNPLGPPPAVRQAVAAADLAAYPEPYARTLARAIAQRVDVPPEAVAVGAGATELIHLCARTMPGPTVALPVPTFSEYRPACEAAGLRVLACPAGALAALRGPGAFLCNPNNPTGELHPPDAVLHLAARTGLLVVDESLIDFVDDPAGASLVRAAARTKGLVVLRSLTKWYAMPGLRVGYAVAHPDLVRLWDARRDPWSVGAAAQAGALAALSPATAAHDRATRAWIGPARRELYAGLARIPGVQPLPPTANFILARGPLPAAELRAILLRDHRILIRGPEGFEGLAPECFRVAVRTPADNARLLAGLVQSTM
jgi:L-threonine-O-3-phosphate decarboxylase